MKIGISLGCFYFWNEKFDIDFKLKHIQVLKDLDIDALELFFSEKDIINQDYKRFCGKLNRFIITVHLPKTTNKKVFENLSEMAKLLGVKHFVIHADQYVKVKDLLKGIDIVIENCDKQKETGQSLKEVESLGGDVCLDINHFEENFPGELEKEIKIIKSRIKELHISALTNKFYDYPHRSSSRHYLIYGSDYKLPKDLPKDALWVIEGIVPKDRLDLLKKEIELLRNF
jgi:hypothetical protein